LRARQERTVGGRRAGEAIPRAYREAIVAAVDAVAQRLAELLGDGPIMLDGEIGDAAPGIDPVRSGERLRRTRVEAAPAGPAMLSVIRRGVRLQLKAGQDHAEE